MGRAAIYVRVSTARQAERDLSLPDQVAQCRRYCHQHGWDVVEVFSEPGASALDEDRPVFQEMIFKATQSDKLFDYVVVHSLSRFSRDSLHTERYARQLPKAGVELVSITQDISPDSGGEFIRKVLNVFDEHQSRENAKHVHRAMLENARQGFWNGSRSPYGYCVMVRERRGTKDKKVLAVNEEEAPVVRLIFDLATGANGRPMGVKAIATHLNERGIARRGRRFSTGGIHDLLTSSTYCGPHHFNRNDSRNGRPRPPSLWIELQVPAIVDEKTFTAVQGLLRSRDPKHVPPRVVNGPTLLAGVARCGYCGMALIQNTGKGGRYRYYCCSRKLKEGPTSCRGMRIRMEQLDDVVLGELLMRILQPEHLHKMLDEYVRTANDRQVADRERIVGQRVQRDELAAEIAGFQKQLTSGEPVVTEEKIARLATLLREKLQSGSPEFRQAYVRLLLREVSVREGEIRIRGSKSVLARAAASSIDQTPPAVLSFVREWRARRDSNS